MTKIKLVRAIFRNLGCPKNLKFVITPLNGKCRSNPFRWVSIHYKRWIWSKKIKNLGWRIFRTAKNLWSMCSLGHPKNGQIWNFWKFHEKIWQKLWTFPLYHFLISPISRKIHNAQDLDFFAYFTRFWPLYWKLCKKSYKKSAKNHFLVMNLIFMTKRGTGRSMSRF